MRSVFHILLVLSLASTTAVWGAGGIAGRVVSSTTGEPLRDARVFVLGHSQSLGMTDLDGRYFIEGVPAGTHSLRVFRTGYDLLAVTDVEVAEGETRRVDVTLNPFDAGSSETEDLSDGDVGGEVFELPALVVTASELQSVDANLLQVRQRSSALSDAMGSESMSRLGLGDAAEALGRVTGTSVVDGKYVVIRGLGDRYTNTMLNGITVPSADPDRRAVQLDQFPSELLESVVTAKSFTPDQPGSFSGGSVNLQTKSFPDQRFLRTSIKVGVNSNVVGEDLLTIPGGGRDWLAMDDGTRSLPSDFPAKMTLTYTQARLAARNGDFTVAQELDRQLAAFDNRSFYPTTKSGEPDLGMSIALGDRLNWDDKSTLGYMFSLKYQRSSSHFTEGTMGVYAEGNRQDFESPGFIDVSRVFTPDQTIYNFYPYIEAGAEVPGGPPPFGVTRSAYSVDWGTLGQIAYAPNGRHEFTVRYYYNQYADDVIKRGVGEAVRSDSGGEFRENIDLLYTERSVASAQLEGKSVFDEIGEGLRVEWRAASSRSTQDQPDYRSLEFKWSYIHNDYDPSGLSQSRYFRNLKDSNVEGAVDFTLPFALKEGRAIEFKVGVLHSEGERTYRGRQFRYENFQLPRNNPEAARARIEGFPNPVGLISINEDARTINFGTSLIETDSNINYDGEQLVTAGYAMVDWRFLRSWRAIFGARYELTDLTTTPLPTSALVVREGRVDQWEWLPAAAWVFEIRENMNLRAAYGRTLARPTYWELADVSVPDPWRGVTRKGNPDLALTLIDNYDLRWEFFPRSSELVAVSVFYKKLTDAIEHTFDQGAITPQNVEDGIVYGIEFEYRQDLAVWSEALRGLSVGLNFALIESEVTIPEADLVAIREVVPDASDKRPLFGQSNYTFNADVSYFVVPWNSTFTLSYNVAGERLDLVTTGPLPDVYEQPTPTLDFNVSKTFRRGWSARLSADNILNSVRETTLTHAGQTFAYDRYRSGRTYALSVAKDF